MRARFTVERFGWQRMQLASLWGLQVLLTIGASNFFGYHNPNNNQTSRV